MVRLIHQRLAVIDLRTALRFGVVCKNWRKAIGLRFFAIGRYLGRWESAPVEEAHSELAGIVRVGKTHKCTLTIEPSRFVWEEGGTGFHHDQYSGNNNWSDNFKVEGNFINLI